MPYLNNIQGWMSEKELQWLYDQASKMGSVLEIGSWKGRSTHALLSGCKGKVVACDAWNPYNMDKTEKKLSKETDVFKEFLLNCGTFYNLEVWKFDTQEAKKMDREFDMVFIDGSHDYASVKDDIETWLPRTKKLICGHDYHSHAPGVLEAVKELLGEVKVEDTIWYKEL